MEQFDLYVHGVPVGHEICGCNEEIDYIKGFYNHDVKVEVSSLLQIDIVNGKSFYTYLRKKNVRNAEGRPGSYFGLTVSFPDRYCTNVQMLYEILDAIYRQVCVNNLIKSETGGDRFLVKQISTSSYKNHSIVEYIKAVFQNNLESLRFDALKGSVNSSSETRFNLKEVDSPLFRETLKTKRILVSPEYGTASVAYSNLLKELKPIKDANVQLERANAQLTESNENLSNEVARLEKELAESNASASKKYKKQLDELQAQLKECEQEREKLDAKIREATSAVDLIDEPFKKLTRLLAGRFQEKDEKAGKKPSEVHSAGWTKHSIKTWFAVVNLILLLCLLGLCWNGFRTISQLSESVTMMQNNLQMTDGTVLNEDDTIDMPEETNKTEEVKEAEGEEEPVYDKYEECRIDISNYSNLSAGTSHILSIKKGQQAANVPRGTWEATPGITINGNAFIVNNDISTPLNIQIYYTVNNKHVITRTITVK